MGVEWGGPNSVDGEGHEALVRWAADCAEHVLHHFEAERPDEDQPRTAIEGARAWARGEIPMTEARDIALQTHAVARETGRTAAREAARAAGHAVATAHVDNHAKEAANYALKAVAAASDDSTAVDVEWEWQSERLPDSLRSVLIADED